MPLLPPDPNPGAVWTDLEPVDLEIGCALGCTTELTMGRVAVPFGVEGDRNGRARMDPTEEDIVSRGLWLDAPAPGLSLALAPPGPVVFDTAIIAADLGPGRMEKVFERGPRPPGLATRLGLVLGSVEVGASTWLTPADRAIGLDLRVDAERVVFSFEASTQSIGDVQRALGEVEAKRVRGGAAGIDVITTLAPRWTVDVGTGSALYVGKRDLAVPMWVHTSTGLTWAIRKGVRWTVIEGAATDTMDEGATPTDLRVSTRVQVRGRAILPTFHPEPQRPLPPVRPAVGSSAPVLRDEPAGGAPSEG